MISLDKFRELDPRFKYMTEQQLLQIREDLYAMGELAFDLWLEDLDVSKNPPGVDGQINGDMQK